jgi:hypothetical protein
LFSVLLLEQLNLLVGRWLVLLVESVVHWLWSAKGACVLAHERVDVA